MNSKQHSEDLLNKSIDYYNINAQDYFENTAFLDISSLYERFLKYLPANAKILDAGCGSGRDSLNFHKLGYAVTAFDASEEMVRMASEFSGIKVLHLSFLDIDFSEVFDGIWACASLLHIPRNQIDNVINLLCCKD